MSDPNVIPIAERGTDAAILKKMEHEIKQAEQWHEWAKLRLSSLRQLRDAFVAREQQQ